METKITNEEIRLFNALYWWQMTGKEAVELLKMAEV